MQSGPKPKEPGLRRGRVMGKSDVSSRPTSPVGISKKRGAYDKTSRSSVEYDGDTLQGEAEGDELKYSEGSGKERTEEASKGKSLALDSYRRITMRAREIVQEKIRHLSSISQASIGRQRQRQRRRRVETAMLSRSRSSSPHSSSTDTAPSSHSSPASSDFTSTENTTHDPSSTWNTQSNMPHNRSYNSKAVYNAGAEDPFGSQTVVQPTLDEGTMFSEYIQDDAFDPAPLAIPLANKSVGPPLTAAHSLFSPQDFKYPQPDAPFANPSPRFTIQPQSVYSSLPQPHYSHPSAIPRLHNEQPQLSSLPPPTATFASTSNTATKAPYSTKASCTNLPILVGNVPERGAKSRVETQIKMDLDLVESTTSSAKGGLVTRQRVCHWKWLRLSRGSVTKKRPKKDAKQDTLPSDTLYLSTEVVCATPPNLRVYPCSNCLSREAKRVERKKASRVRPARSDSDDDESARVPTAVVNQQRQDEERGDYGADDGSNVYRNSAERAAGLGIANSDEGSKIVLFNCPELLDMSKGSVSLPVRITCYCRHHREKMGFRIIFTMRNHTGRLVGRGTAPPIMITDDHKSSHKKGSANVEDDEDDEPAQPIQSKRKRKGVKKESTSQSIDEDGMHLDAGEAGSPDEDVPEEDEEEDADYRIPKRRAKGGMSSAMPSAPGSAANSRPGTSMGGRRPSAITNSNLGVNGGHFTAASQRSSRLGTPSRRSTPPPNPALSMSARTPSSSGLVSPNSREPSSSLSPSQSPFNFYLPPSSVSGGSMMGASPAMTFSSDMSSVDNLGGGGTTNPNSGIEMVLASLDAMVASTASGGTYDGDGSNLNQMANGRSSSSPSPLSPFHALQQAPYLPTFGQNTSPTTSMTNVSPGLNAMPLTAPPLPQAFDTSALFALFPQHHQSAAPPPAPAPVIHRLVPSSGPMHGGIEVTILGAHFLQSHECVFGDTVASSTQMWSENTIVCVLPPSPCPGPVVVGFKGFPVGGVAGGGVGDGSGMSMGGLLGLDNVLGGMGMNMGGSNNIQLFTYLDNTDRALMELALQVVGLKMTGRVEEARNVAMRIVGSNASMDVSTTASAPNGGNSMSGATTTARSVNHSPAVSRSQSVSNLVASAAASPSAAAIAAALNSRSRDFQSVIIEFMSLLDVELDGVPSSSLVSVPDAVSHPNASRQTLLHLAAILGFHRLIAALIARGIDVDARDMNGYTALHFAASCGRLACARVLLEGGADVEVVEARGRSARQLARERDQVDLDMLLEGAERMASDLSDHRGRGGVSGGQRRGVSRGYDADGDTEESFAEEDVSGSGESGDQYPEDQVSDVEEQKPSLNVTPTSHSVTFGPHRPQTVSHSSGPNKVAEGLHPRHRPAPAAERDLYSSADEAEDESSPRDTHIPSPIDKEQPPPPPGWFYRTLHPVNKALGTAGGVVPWGLPNLPYLPQLPNLPYLPQLPNIPMNIPDITVFPYAVQWPTTWQWQPGPPGGEKRAVFANAYGWWAEKEPSVPMYPHSEGVSAEGVGPEGPSFVEDDQQQQQQQAQSGPSKALVKAKLARRLGYEPEQVTDHEVQAYAYYSKKMRKLKQDRMLVLFWLPILLLVVAWGLYECIPTVVQTARRFMPLRDPIHI